MAVTHACIGCMLQPHACASSTGEGLELRRTSGGRRESAEAHGVSTGDSRLWLPSALWSQLSKVVMDQRDMASTFPTTYIHTVALV